ncbi:MAG: hypothetical protein M1831_005795 [Alyxoria varia]|nr:MAG: hypothetical protein M1831_005795 [Alyxoria varia]
MSNLDIYADAYFGTLVRNNGEVEMIPDDKPNGATESLPTAGMEKQAAKAGYDHSQAYHRIRSKFMEHLSRVTGPSESPVKLINNVDRSVPSLNFKFINNYVFREGVQEPDRNAIVGCGDQKLGFQYCRPNMGQHIGCEYSKVCECLEFAAIDESRLTDEQKALLKRDPDLKTGLPKRFPYSSHKYLVNFYLDSRHPIYECNFRCNCGEVCKSRLVQFGRRIPLEIFKTTNRGWGLRCPVDLKKGQFIDTYRGEVITGTEADKREAKQREKASYLYNLDKHCGDELAEEDHYVVDGEYYGGPTRFMNHSCEPNCRQYTVSYDRYNYFVYDLAFFAYEDIPAYTELTFDYKDKDDEDEEEEGPPAASQQSEEAGNTMDCKCGSSRCRGKLWM